MRSYWKNLRDGLLRRLAPRLGYAYLSLVGATSSVRWAGREHLEAVRAAGGNWAFALWHSRQAFLTFSHRDEGIAVMVSRSKDGDIMAEVLRLSGELPVRGSSSRGGAAALKELVEAGREGHPLAITPDGPRGPAGRVQAGILFLARELKIPIIPLASGMRRKMVLRSWDRFQFPLPFNRVAVVYGPPFTVGLEDDLEAKAEELRLALDAVTEEADRIAEQK